MILGKRIDDGWELNALFRVPEGLLGGIQTLTAIDAWLVGIKLSLKVSILLVKGDLRGTAHLETSPRVLVLFPEHDVKLSIGTLGRAENFSADPVAFNYLSATSILRLGT